jgi:hypothetical protein
LWRRVSTLGAFGVVQLSKNPELNEQWLKKYGTMIKILGPIVTLYGVAQFFGFLN